MKRGLLIFSVILIIGVLSIGFVSAGLIDWFKNILGNDNYKITGESVSNNGSTDQTNTPTTSSSCGDGKCYGNYGESYINCPSDCIISTPPDCGDKICANETKFIFINSSAMYKEFSINGNNFKITYNMAVPDGTWINLRVDNFNRTLYYKYEYNSIKALPGAKARIAGLSIELIKINGSEINFLAGENEILCPVDCSYTIPTCTDSDDGLKYKILGNTFNSSTSFSDYCKDNQTIFEYSCDSSGDAIKKQEYNCPDGCVDGICIIDLNCKDSDGGLNYDVKGKTTGDWYGPSNSYEDYVELDDLCDTNPGQSDYIWEYYCNGTDDVRGVRYLCPHGCLNGVCINQTIPSSTNTETSSSSSSGGGEEVLLQHLLQKLVQQPLLLQLQVQLKVVLLKQQEIKLR
ncbi:MAG: hypothetical protein WCX73_02510 [Candidatus Pacearchaeota archaeon]|jgi:hypothetical protein